jgi:Tfp pilus assembly protein PilN
MIINVLAWREEKQVKLKKVFLKQSIIAIFIGILIVICMHFIFIQRLNTQEKENKSISQAIDGYDKIIHNAAPATTLVQTIQQKRNVIAVLKNKQTETVELFNLLQSLLPKDVYLTQINRAGNTITLTGNVSHNEAISNLMKHLETSPNFKAVHLKKVSAQKFEINLMEAP